MKALNALILLSAIPAFACSSGGLQHRVASEMVGALPKDARISLETKERHLQDSKTALDQANKDHQAALLELQRAEHDLEVTTSRLDASRERLTFAQEGQLSERAEYEARIGAALEAMVDANEEEIEWRELGVTYSTTKQELAAQRVLLAEAELEAAKAEAVSKSNVTGKETVVLSDFQLQVSQELEKASDLEKRSSSEWEDVKEAEKTYNEAFAKVPIDASPERAQLAKSKSDHDQAKAELELLKKRIEELETAKRNLETRAADAAQKAVDAEKKAADAEQEVAEAEKKGEE